MQNPETKNLLDDAYGHKTNFYEHANPNWREDPFSAINYPSPPGDASRSQEFLQSIGRQSVAFPAAGGAVKEAAQGIRAYHGSPHDFDKFSLDAMGTGHGNQAFGSGLYFSENEGIAKTYRDRVSNGRPIKGHMYEVNINASPDDFLDWDKPMAQQRDHLKDAFYSVMPPHESPNSAYGHVLPRAVMDDVSQAMGLHPASAEAKTGPPRVLSEKGIAGISYLDKGKAGGEPSRNYVAFDASLIEILRKYGLLPPAALGAAASQDPAQQ